MHIIRSVAIWVSIIIEHHLSTPLWDLENISIVPSAFIPRSEHAFIDFEIRFDFHDLDRRFGIVNCTSPSHQRLTDAKPGTSRLRLRLTAEPFATTSRSMSGRGPHISDPSNPAHLRPSYLQLSPSGRNTSVHQYRRPHAQTRSPDRIYSSALTANLR